MLSKKDAFEEEARASLTTEKTPEGWRGDSRARRRSAARRARNSHACACVRHRGVTAQAYALQPLRRPEPQGAHVQLATFTMVPSAAPAAVHVYVKPVLRTPMAPTLALRLAAPPQHNCGSSARRAAADLSTATRATRATRRAPVLHAGRRTAGMRAVAHAAW